jgi:type III pantothenate kinase
MATTLCIDWGNTCIKLAIFSGDKIVETHTFTEDQLASVIDQIIPEHKPQGAILSAVAGNAAYLLLTLREHIPHVVELNMNTPLPIMNAYSSPQTLGTDRLAMAVAAQHNWPGTNVLAIGIGTCVTYNFVQKNKAFRGGAISPGLHMRLKALHEYTDNLPQVALEGDTLLLGYDTETSIRSGVVYGLCAEIEGIIALYAAQYPEFNAVLTGGDAAFFEGKLKSSIFADPNLIFKGLNLILLHNVPQLR